MTTQDVNLTARVYGEDISIIKSMTTRCCATPVTRNLIEIPNELIEVQKDIIISIDGITVNSTAFLTTISHKIY